MIGLAVLVGLAEDACLRALDHEVTEDLIAQLVQLFVARVGQAVAEGADAVRDQRLRDSNAAETAHLVHLVLHLLGHVRNGLPLVLFTRLCSRINDGAILLLIDLQGWPALQFCFTYLFRFYNDWLLAKSVYLLELLFSFLFTATDDVV